MRLEAPFGKRNANVAIHINFTKIFQKKICLTIFKETKENYLCAPIFNNKLTYSGENKQKRIKLTCLKS